MIMKHAGILARALGVVALAVAAGAPLVTVAQAHGGGGGGGGHSGGGGGHFGGGGGGGGHAAFAGGGHANFAAGGHASYAGGHAGFAGGGAHVYGGASHAHYAASGNHVYGGYAGGGGHFVGHPTGYAGGHAGYGWRPGYGGHIGGTGRFWGGGYWGGRYWPGSRYGVGFAWFLPVLPFGYATYYWGGLPYYYYDNAYYQWDPSYNGYVATDPPPVAQSGSNEPAPGDVPDGSDAPSADYVPAPQSNDSPLPESSNSVASSAASAGPRGNWGGAADIFVYPRNGQSEQQTATDRFECHKWSVSQTGFDPTRSVNLQGTSTDYRRAMGACMDARGYSVK